MTTPKKITAHIDPSQAIDLRYTLFVDDKYHGCFDDRRALMGAGCILANRNNTELTVIDCTNDPRLSKLNVHDSHIQDENFKCVCGNTSHTSGFYPCTRSGEVVEPTAKNWPECLYMCGACDRIHRDIDAADIRVLSAADEIYNAVFEAMQPAEERFGPDGLDYVRLMLRIASQASTRAATYMERLVEEGTEV